MLCKCYVYVAESCGARRKVTKGLHTTSASARPLSAPAQSSRRKRGGHRGIVCKSQTCFLLRHSLKNMTSEQENTNGTNYYIAR